MNTETPSAIGHSADLAEDALQECIRYCNEKFKESTTDPNWLYRCFIHASYAYEDAVVLQRYHNRQMALATGRRPKRVKFRNSFQIMELLDPRVKQILLDALKKSILMRLQ